MKFRFVPMASPFLVVNSATISAAAMRLSRFRRASWIVARGGQHCWVVSKKELLALHSTASSQ